MFLTFLEMKQYGPAAYAWEISYNRSIFLWSTVNSTWFISTV